MSSRHWWLWGFSLTLSMAVCAFFFLDQQAILLYPEMYGGTDDLPEPYGGALVIGMLLLQGVTLFFVAMHIFFHFII